MRFMKYFQRLEVDCMVYHVKLDAWKSQRHMYVRPCFRYWRLTLALLLTGIISRDGYKRSKIVDPAREEHPMKDSFI